MGTFSLPELLQILTGDDAHHFHALFGPSVSTRVALTLDVENGPAILIWRDRGTVFDDANEMAFGIPLVSNGGVVTAILGRQRDNDLVMSMTDHDRNRADICFLLYYHEGDGMHVAKMDADVPLDPYWVKCARAPNGAMTFIERRSIGHLATDMIAIDGRVMVKGVDGRAYFFTRDALDRAIEEDVGLGGTYAYAVIDALPSDARLVRGPRTEVHGEVYPRPFAYITRGEDGLGVMIVIDPLTVNEVDIIALPVEDNVVYTADMTGRRVLRVSGVGELWRVTSMPAQDFHGSCAANF